MIDFNIAALTNRALLAVNESERTRRTDSLDQILHEAESNGLLDLVAYLRAQEARLASNFEEALRLLDQALELAPRFVAAHLLKVAVLTESGQYHDALGWSNHVMQNIALSNYAIFHLNKGVVYERLGKYQEARLAYLKAIDESETYDLAFHYLLLICSKMKAWEDILAVSERVREKFKDKPTVLTRTAVAILQAGEGALKEGRPEWDISLSEEARKFTEIVVSLEPKNPTAWYNLACTYARLGRRDDAVGTLRKTLDMEKAKGEDRLRKKAAVDEDFAKLREADVFKQLLEVG